MKAKPKVSRCDRCHLRGIEVTEYQGVLEKWNLCRECYDYECDRGLL